MNAVFADTSYYAALWAPADAGHAAATKWSCTVGRIVLTDCVILEFANFVARSQWRSFLKEFVDDLRADPLVQIVPASRALLDKGLALYADRPDKQWSLTDCISFVVMSEHGITEALTTDHHFEQAGFKALLA